MLTGGYAPADATVDAIRRADLFATLVPQDTYVGRIGHPRPPGQNPPGDAGKIAEIKALVWEYLFIDRLLAVATEVDLADRRLAQAGSRNGYAAPGAASKTMAATRSDPGDQHPQRSAPAVTAVRCR